MTKTGPNFVAVRSRLFPTSSTLLNSVSWSDSPFSNDSVVLRPSILKVEAVHRHASVVSRVPHELPGGGDAPSITGFLIQEVLRFWQKGKGMPRLARINSGFRLWNLLAAKGDTLIHGPHLVAQSVGSEWRNQHLFQVVNQTN
jgi:hypothetical protein